MKKILFIFLAICLLSCNDKNRPQVVTVETSNKDYDVVLLFEVDSIKVYRFSDGYRDVYFTNSKGRVDYNYTTRSGKTATTTHTQTTLTN